MISRLVYCIYYLQFELLQLRQNEQQKWINSCKNSFFVKKKGLGLFGAKNYEEKQKKCLSAHIYR